MTHLMDMIWIEMRKTVRSRMPILCILGSCFMPLGIAFLLFIVRHPEISAKLGIVSAKANLTAVNATNWPSYLNLSAEMVAAGGFFFFCIATSWIFGREFTDGTIKDLLAVPVQRSSILMAKFIVSAMWSLIMTIIMLILCILVGGMSNLPGGSTAVIFQGSLVVAITAGLTILVVTPFALFASIGRGYLFPLGIAILALISANIAAVAGLGDKFPWAIPGLYAQSKGVLESASGYWVAAITGLAGIVCTYLWWKYADQNK
jgi:ABC-2 type transport system permease protein